MRSLRSLYRLVLLITNAACAAKTSTESMVARSGRKPLLGSIEADQTKRIPLRVFQWNEQKIIWIPTILLGLLLATYSGA